MRILLIDDHPINRKLGQLVLKRLSSSVDVVNDGLQAIAALQQKEYDVLVMDVYMPNLDGMETTRRIRAEFSADAQPYIIAATSDITDESRARFQAAGMDDFVAKPMSEDRMRAALQRFRARTADPAENQAEDQAENQVEDQAEGQVEDQAYLAGAQSSNDSAVLDPAALKSLRAMLGPNADVHLPALIRAFHESTCQALAHAKNARRDGDLVVLRRSAHNIKSNATNVGATRLADVARQLEHLDPDELGRADELLADIALEYAKVERVLPPI